MAISIGSKGDKQASPTQTWEARSYGVYLSDRTTSIELGEEEERSLLRRLTQTQKTRMICS